MATTEQFVEWLKQAADQLNRTPEEVLQETGHEAEEAFNNGNTVEDYVKHFRYEEMLYADRMYS